MKDLLEWWNAIYWVPLGLSLLWILLTALSGGGHAHGAGQVHSGGAHLGPHLGHGHLHVGHAAHGTAASHAGVAHHGHAIGHGHAPSHAHFPTVRDTLSSRVISLLGLGRVPITLIAGLYMLLWGTFGLLANSILHDAGFLPAVYILPSLVGTFLASSIVTRLSVGIIARYMPTTESFAITDSDLIGREGSVVYAVTENAGTVQVTDAYGTVHRRMAQTEPGASPLPANSKIIVIGLDEAGDRLIVREYSDTAQIP